MNIVCLMGRLTHNPELRYSQKGNAVATYTLAYNRGDERIDFFDVVAFGKAAEFAGKYLKKGQRIAIQGELQQDSFVDRNGQKRTSYKIVAKQQDFADAKKPEEEAEKEPEDKDFMSVPEDEDVPFE